MASMMRRWVGLCAGVTVGMGAWSAPSAAQGIEGAYAAGPAPTGVVVPGPDYSGYSVGLNGHGCADGHCGTGNCATGTCGRKSCGLCGLKQYPMSDKRYIRQFCGPTINPGSCFGHYKTQWTRWNDACPNWGGGDLYPTTVVHGAVPQPAGPSPAPTTPIAPAPSSSDASPKPLPTPKSTDNLPPLKEPEKAKPPVAPTTAPLTVPPVAPPAPTVKPNEPSSRSTTPIPVPLADPRLVVPAVPDAPSADPAIPAIPVSAPVKF